MNLRFELTYHFTELQSVWSRIERFAILYHFLINSQFNDGIHTNTNFIFALIFSTLPWNVRVSCGVMSSLDSLDMILFLNKKCFDTISGSTGYFRISWSGQTGTLDLDNSHFKRIFQMLATRHLLVYTVKTTQCWIHYRIDACKM